MAKQKKKTKLMRDLEKWLKKPENTAAKIAVSLGLSCSYSVRQWLNRRSIPSWRQEQVRKIIGQ
jgi:hypothetical protein